MTRTKNQRSPQSSSGVLDGEKIGRFSILSEVGVGGMGRIYEAYDPNLDRRIALKLLHDSGEGAHRQRLVREAKALARLDHPNVVTVHDVGVHQGGFFLAMEFVRGGTLKEWLANNPVGAKERLETGMRLLVGAGRGLVAAHAAELVHRDVKPSNILIGQDGRARVADFGIARAFESHGSPSESPVRTSDEGLLLSTDDSESGLTRTETSIGTPAYMAPEQYGRGPVGAAADQFSFCVTAWELVFGVRPFEGADGRERLAAIQSGTLRRPKEIEVEVELEALLRRGLHYRPSDRHGRLEDLVDELSQSLGADAGSGRPSLRRWGLAVVSIGLLGAGGAYRFGQTEGRCGGAAMSFEEVWDGGRREKLRAVVLGSGLEFKAGAWARLEAGIDAYARGWRGAYTEACEATRVLGEQSPERMEERVACLDDAKRSVAALVTLVSSGEASVIANEHELLDGLPRVEDCADIRGMPVPADLFMLDALARAGVKRSAGQSVEALQIIEPVAEGLREETSEIVRARVLLEYGRGLSEASNPRRAFEPLSEAYAVAHAAGLRQLAAAAAREVATVHALLLGEPDTLRSWLELANSEGLEPSVSERYELLTLEGMLLRLAGDNEGAIGMFERSVEVASENPDLLPHARRRFAEELYKRRRYERALKVGRQAMRDYQAQFGADHPGVAIFESSLAGTLVRVRGGEEADELSRRAVERVKNLWGEENVAMSPYLNRLSLVQCDLHRDVDEGLRLAKAALRLHTKGSATTARRRAFVVLRNCARSSEPKLASELSGELVEVSKALYGEKHQTTALDRAKYASDLLQTSEPERAWTQISLATALVDDEIPGWNFYDAIELHRLLGGSARVIGEGAAALKHAEAALQLLEKEGSQDARANTSVRVGLCRARRSVGDLEGALPQCLIALGIISQALEPLFLAEVEHTVGEVLHVLGRDEEALPHGQNSLRLLKTLNVSGPHSLWLAHSHFGVGRINESLGRYTEAEKHFRASFELLSTSRDAGRIAAGAGVVRMAARLGRVSEARELLEDLSTMSRRTNPFEQASLSVARGYILHVNNPRKGAREYSEALDFLRAARSTVEILRVCRESPLELAGCDNSTRSD